MMQTNSALRGLKLTSSNHIDIAARGGKFSLQAATAELRFGECC